MRTTQTSQPQKDYTMSQLYLFAPTTLIPLKDWREREHHDPAPAIYSLLDFFDEDVIMHENTTADTPHAKNR